jgi:hypothetical protein
MCIGGQSLRIGAIVRPYPHRSGQVRNEVSLVRRHESLKAYTLTILLVLTFDRGMMHFSLM